MLEHLCFFLRCTRLNSLYDEYIYRYPLREVSKKNLFIEGGRHQSRVAIGVFWGIGGYFSQGHFVRVCPRGGCYRAEVGAQQVPARWAEHFVTLGCLGLPVALDALPWLRSEEVWA